jgi:hypothetical protein
MRLGDIEDPKRYLGGVVNDLGLESWLRDDAISIGYELLVKWEKQLEPGDSLFRVANGMIGNRIRNGLRPEWAYQKRVRSLDELEAERDEDDVPRYQPAATYGPELVDQIASADALAAFQSASDFSDTRVIGRWVGGLPSHRPAPPVRATEVDLARQHELRLLGRPLFNFNNKPE